MEILLDDVEIRVLGCLVEKETTTPDYYPLTLNALTNACNQKSNRNPVVAFEETDVVRALDSLRHKGLAMLAGAESGRVPKYRHCLAEKLHLEEGEIAVISELMLRGPQTVGEIRGRAERMYAFAGLEEVEKLLEDLMERDTPLTVKLPRQAGRKESRYMHLLGGEPEVSEYEGAAEPAALKVRGESERIVRLEEEVSELREEIEALKKNFAEFRAQFE